MACTAIDLLGGEKVLGKNVRNTGGMVARLRAGLPYRSLEAVRGTLSMSRGEAARSMAIPLRTLDRRRRQGRLSQPESERVYRMARLCARAAEVLGSSDNAAHWLREPNAALGMVSPLEMLDTELGAREVERVLGRVEHGVYS